MKRKASHFFRPKPVVIGSKKSHFLIFIWWRSVWKRTGYGNECLYCLLVKFNYSLTFQNMSDCFIAYFFSSDWWITWLTISCHQFEKDLSTKRSKLSQGKTFAHEIRTVCLLCLIAPRQVFSIMHATHFLSLIDYTNALPMGFVPRILPAETDRYVPFHFRPPQIINDQPLTNL